MESSNFRPAPMGFFRPLGPEQERAFREWARENYKPNDKINIVWHPAVRAECEQINLEATRKTEERS